VLFESLIDQASQLIAQFSKTLKFVLRLGKANLGQAFYRLLIGFIDLHLLCDRQKLPFFKLDVIVHLIEAEISSEHSQMNFRVDLEFLVQL